MYVLLALIASCALGIGLHYLIGGRELRGVLVTPAIATVTAGIIYTALQWAGLAETSPWLWVASILGGLLIAVVVTVAISASRRRTDASARLTLGI